MKIIVGYPPNIEKIRKRFDMKDFTPVFAWGNILYNPSGLPIPDDLMIHEQQHETQQKDKVEEWWNQYLTNDNFRLWQEVEAYRAQYKFVRDKTDRKSSRNFLRLIAQNLASSLYGHIVTFEKAKELIKKS